jgi:drug/metabolite transporter (DMT)-like permease
MNSIIQNKKFIVIFSLFTAYLFLVMLDSLVKYLAEFILIEQLLWARYFFHLIFILLFFLIKKPPINLKKNFKIQLLRSVLMISITVLLFISFKNLDLTNVYVLFFSAPIFLALMASFFLKDNLSKTGWLLTILSFVSILYSLEPEKFAFTIYTFMPLIAGLAYAAYQFLTKLLSKDREPFTALFYSALLGTLFFSIYSLIDWTPISQPIFWLGLVLIGFLGFLGHLLIIYAIQFSNLSFVSSFQYSQIIWGAIFNYFIFNISISDKKLIGIILVVIFGLLFIKTEMGKIEKI